MSSVNSFGFALKLKLSKLGRSAERVFALDAK